MSDRKPPRYYQSLEVLADTLNGDADALAKVEREFQEELPVGKDAQDKASWIRRDFFKAMGLSVAAFAVACKRAPVTNIVPYLQKPDEITPGVANYYASSCGGCAAGCGVLVKARDGRPIKLEGNEIHPWTNGGACAVGQASVLALYDAARARGPLSSGNPTKWIDLDARVAAGLKTGKAVRVVVPSTMGPSAEAALGKLLAGLPNARIVRHEPLGERMAIAEAHFVTHGQRAVPTHRLDKAKLVVSIGADFLGTWLSPVAFTKQYSEARSLEKRTSMLRHVQLESLMTLTGSNADKRIVIGPGDDIPILAGIIKELLAKTPHDAKAQISTAIAAIPKSELEYATVVELADALFRAKGEALVVCGSTDPAAQVATNVLNELIGAYGATVGVEEQSSLDSKTIAFDAFLTELRGGSVGAVILVDVNPVYDHPAGGELKDLLAKVELTVSTGDRLDETGKAVQHVAPSHHYLESWDDVAQTRAIVGMRQPAIAPLWDTRASWESILRWAGVGQTYRDFIKDRWQKDVFPVAEDKPLAFRDFWERAVRDGFAVIAVKPLEDDQFRATQLTQAMGVRSATGAPTDLAVVLYAKVALRDGALANNAWLHELPDPITKATWTNYAMIGPSLASSLGVRSGSVVSVTVDGKSVTLPVVVQPGVHPRAIGLAVGYGRTSVGTIGDNIGANAYPLGRFERGRVERTHPGAKIAATGQVIELALAQTHASLEGRPHVKETTLEEFLKNPKAGNEDEEKRPRSLWSGHKYDGHRWAMSVDLTACTGCSACVVGCHAENNVPVVGPDEIRRGRDMSWMRIDRYFAGSPEAPTVVHQPMMCQHCENAPCETVCPVLATAHSSEGLNMQVYNRCVGTRYCANNCPPKVRRFNWFDYHDPDGPGKTAVLAAQGMVPTGSTVKVDDSLSRMVLNPDVVVRSRGVMEKCSMCVQRIQEGKAQAKLEGHKLRDGDVKTACQQSCPANAIVFGDLNDPQSQVAKLAKDERSYKVLTELNIESSIRYMTKVRNGGKA